VAGRGIRDVVVVVVLEVVIVVVTEADEAGVIVVEVVDEDDEDEDDAEKALLGTTGGEGEVCEDGAREDAGRGMWDAPGMREEGPAGMREDVDKDVVGFDGEAAESRPAFGVAGAFFSAALKKRERGKKHR